MGQRFPFVLPPLFPPPRPVVDEPKAPAAKADSPKPAKAGPAACCGRPFGKLQNFKAGTVQLLATGLSFGTKPLFEAAVTAAGAGPWGTAVAGGVYVGIMQTVSAPSSPAC